MNSELDVQCRRIAAWSIAIERAMNLSGDRETEVVELAEALDAHFGWEPFRSAEEEPDAFASAALANLRIATNDDLENAIQKLPVFPLAAQRALGLLLSDDWHARELETVIGSDQALAAHLLRAANSWMNSPLQTIATIPHAVTYIGAEQSCRIVYAASVRPMFASPQLRDLWHHSVAAAEVAQSLAEISKGIDPKKAFLAGLVHDIGVLVMSSFPATFQKFFRQLATLGCEQILVERALAGLSHTQAGARALKTWKFPDDIVEGVEFHHAPEASTSKMASLLYLTEQWTDSSEDAPSAARFKAARDRLGISQRQFEQLAPSDYRMVAALGF